MKNQNREKAIDSFVKEHSKEYCQEQIDYFKKMKKKNN